MVIEHLSALAADSAQGSNGQSVRDAIEQQLSSLCWEAGNEEPDFGEKFREHLHSSASENVGAGGRVAVLPATYLHRQYIRPITIPEGGRAVCIHYGGRGMGDMPAYLLVLGPEVILQDSAFSTSDEFKARNFALFGLYLKGDRGSSATKRPRTKFKTLQAVNRRLMRIGQPL
ncbi:uncharacterized protein ATNIH1004_010429 [Aspergillus tanneri]|uniref:Uncharacterized protein n=1 Tax=Aspergillus tanneri TaxID=1220188 RepID=A0A5M9MDW3_9EURO|nr:uncharacterized protein ATNIH1004_010429 [Aspergillus tanneri]KAA8643660.1 hypothetical protein ATNIH1004_010429 [Aspergillus tanneri]